MFSISSNIFSARHKEIVDSGIKSVNLSKKFKRTSDSKLKDIEIFLDYIHVTENGNQLIADELMKLILDL